MSPLLFLVVMLLFMPCVAQDSLIDDKLIQRAEELNYFISNNGAKFSEETISLSLEQMDLLDRIEGYNYKRLLLYVNMTNFYSRSQLQEECINAVRKFFKLRKASESLLSPEEEQGVGENMHLVYSIAAEAFDSFEMVDSVKYYYRESIKWGTKSPSILYPSAINNYALYLEYRLHDKDSALYYYKQAYDIAAKQYPKHYLIGSIRDNIADNYRGRRMLSEANELYRENFEFFSNMRNDQGIFEDVPRLVSAGAQLVATDLELKNEKVGVQDFERMQSLLKEVTMPLETQLEFLTSEQAYFEAKRNAEAANTTGKIIRRLTDSLSKSKVEETRHVSSLMNGITLNKIQLKHQLEQMERENTIRIQKYSIWIILLISFIVVGVSFFLYKRRQQRIINLQNQQLLSEQELELTALKNAQLTAEIDSKKRDLTDFAINLSQSMEWARDLKEKIAAKKSGLGKEGQELVAELESEIATKIQFDQHNEEFLERLDTLSDVFYSNLKARYPKLTNSERRLCSLIRLKLERQQIANLQNISLASLHTARYRLRKKMDLPEAVDLDEHIQQL